MGGSPEILMFYGPRIIPYIYGRPLILMFLFIYLFIFCRFLAQLETFPVCHLTHAPIKVAVQCFPLSVSSAAHCDVKPLNI